ncbi:hypothetical protein NDU88_001794 [Pleurodeles waltl]|uniref:Uncharacterized protein n=1 Tax=Pleurodeles waltl TaxID=8319 RepID=A0AAV7WLN7_PLEWA|nr:hypothetical protein NDU88_001794 [Pleurodeles waltl]
MYTQSWGARVGIPLGRPSIPHRIKGLRVAGLQFGSAIEPRYLAGWANYVLHMGGRARPPYFLLLCSVRGMSRGTLVDLFAGGEALSDAVAAAHTPSPFPHSRARRHSLGLTRSGFGNGNCGRSELRVFAAPGPDATRGSVKLRGRLKAENGAPAEARSSPASVAPPSGSHTIRQTDHAPSQRSSEVVGYGGITEDLQILYRINKSRAKHVFNIYF